VPIPFLYQTRVVRMKGNCEIRGEHLDAPMRLRWLTQTKGGPKLGRLITGRTEDYGNSGRRLS